MYIILKFILKNITEKKFRTFLIVLAVTLSAALFFASTALSGTMVKTFMGRVKKYYGAADLMIHPNQKSPAWLFQLSRNTLNDPRLEYLVGAIETRAVYQTPKESLQIDLKGFNIADLRKHNPFILETRQALTPFEGRKIILSRKTAGKLQLKVGDKLELTLNERRHRFTIVGITQPLGLFQEDGRSNTAVVPRETLARLLGAPGRASVFYLKLKNPARVEQFLSELTKEYRRFTVRVPFSQAELRQYTQAVTVPFQIMVILVLVMSIYIIYSSFKVITRERLPLIGTFRSIGATRRMTDAVLFLESGVYGVVGGIGGVLLGIAILLGMALMMRPEWLKEVPIELDLKMGHALGAFGLALGLPLISAAIPIIKISKLPVKEIVLNAVEQPRRHRGARLIAGLILLGLALTVPACAPQQWALLLDGLCLVLAVAATVALVPFLTGGFIKVFEGLYDRLLGNEGVLAAKNLRENQIMLNNIALLAIGISSLLMINTISFSVIKEVANFFKDATFQIWMGYYQADRQFLNVVRSVDGVADLSAVYEADNIELDQLDEKIRLINGVDPNRFLEFWDLVMEGDRSTLMQELDQGRNILVSLILKDKLQLKRGDLLTLNMARGKRTYRVIGFFHSLMHSGSFALVAGRYLKNDMQLQYYSDIYLKTDRDPPKVAQEIKKRFGRKQPWVETMRQIAESELHSQQQTFALLQGFSLMTLVIGIFGVFNNLIISFLERKRSLAMMRSVGLSRSQTLKMILIESLTGGMIGGLVGMLSGTLLIGLVPYFMRAINQVAPLHYSAKEYLVAFGSGVLITVAASVGPAFKSSRFNIIEAIKYE